MKKAGKVVGTDRLPSFEHPKMIKRDLSFDEFRTKTAKRFVINSTAHLYCYKSIERCYFYFRYSDFNGKRREMPLLTSFPINIKKTDWNRLKKTAVHHALEHWFERYNKDQPIDPIETRRMNHPRWRGHIKSPHPIFRKVMEEWLKGFKDAQSWTNWEKRAAHYRGLLRLYAKDIAQTEIDRITPEDIWTAIKPIWQSRPSTADLLLGLFNKVFVWAINQRDRATQEKRWAIKENPADRKGILSNDIALFSNHRAKRENFSALDYREIPLFMKALYEEQSPLSLGLMFQILTATRTQAVRLMRHDEIHQNESGFLWEIPEAHDKMKDRGRNQKTQRERTIYLSEQALRVIQEAQRFSREKSSSAYVFTGRNPIKPMGATSFNTLINRLDAQKELEDAKNRQSPAALRGWKDKQKYDEWKKIRQIDGQKPPKFVITAHGTSRASFKSWAMNQKDRNGRPKYREVVIEFSLLHQDRNDHFGGAYSRSRYIEERIALMQDWGRFCFSKIDADGTKE